MMKSKLKGFIFFSKKIKDNDLYIQVLSSNDEIVSGIIYGGNSSKKKIIYQNGYFIDFITSRKNQNAPLMFSGDLTSPFLGSIYDDKYKMSALFSIMSLIKISMLEGQYIKGFYENLENLINKIIYKKHWITYYCEWLFKLLELIGYQIDYKNNKNYLYFNLSTQDFDTELQNSCIEFPYNLFDLKTNISFKNINSIFLIFESIFLKNHLDNINYKMPLSYLNFKKIILHQLKH